MFGRILVAMDFSASSDAALACARDVAMQFGASLHLLHMVEDPYRAVYGAEVYVPEVEGLRDELLTLAVARLRQTLLPSDVTDLHATTAAVIGAAAWGIIEYAGAHDIDLIVMGTHGRGGMSHLLMGSVAEQVVRTAPCPVLTIRQARTRRAAGAKPEAAEEVPPVLVTTSAADARR